MSKKDEGKMNIEEAAAQVAAASTIEVTCSNKQSYEIRLMPWDSFQTMWDELGGIVSAVIGEGTELEGGLIGQITKAPHLVTKLISLSSDLTEGDVVKLGNAGSYIDVLKLGRAALKVNFIDNKELFAFFNDAMSAVGLKVEK